VPSEVLEKEKRNLQRSGALLWKAREHIDKIAEGKLESYYEMACLYDQKFVKDPNITVKELINNAIGKIGENIQVRPVSRDSRTGEGMEKRSTILQRMSRKLSANNNDEIQARSAKLSGEV
jgi:elongation factor Ts